MKMPTLLIIDDDQLLLSAFAHIFGQLGFTVRTASSAATGLEMLSQQQPDVVLLDLNLPDQYGLEVFRHIHRFNTRIPVIFLTGTGTTETAIEAMKRGAYDYFIKPVEVEKLKEQVAGAASVSQLMRLPAEAVAEERSPELAYALVGRAPAMQEVYKAIGRVAPKDLTVLILGESGTGKELVAWSIYKHSKRADKQFLAINCAAIPEQLLESELFGHEKGAFTGADRKRVGKFEECSGGTLFLDEIGDMTQLTQTKILRVLQEQRFERVGGNETVQTDVRLIAATNCNLERAVAAGRFRGDLYYRLSGITITLPPLRDRGEDLPLLVEYFLRRFNPELGKEVRHVAPEAMTILQGYHWPGNVRELQSVLRHALLHATGPVLQPEFLPTYLRPEQGAPRSSSPKGIPGWEQFLEERFKGGARDLYAEALTLMERDLLTRVLTYTKGNKVRAAEMLGISRANLRAKILANGVVIERRRSP
jgi:two-component system, NtrC family, nitrogen regulation response regulator GlnG